MEPLPQKPVKPGELSGAAVSEQSGELPERWNVSHPEEIVRIQKAYFDAGSNVVLTNTFGANTLKFGEEELNALVAAAFRNARKAAELSIGSQKKFVGLDVGPRGCLSAGRIHGSGF